MTGGWVCPQCGLDYDTISPLDTAVAVRSFPRRYRALLTTFDDGDDPESIIRRRPDHSTWSALEYTAHVADGLESMIPIIQSIVTQEEPTFGPGFDPDERAAEQQYNQQERGEVLDRLERVSNDLAAVLEGVPPGDWRRIGHLPFGDRDALGIARNAVHEGAHHLRDVERVLNSVR